MYDRFSILFYLTQLLLSKPPPYVTAPFALPQASTSSTGINTSSTQQSLIEKYKLEDAVKRGLIPPEPPKKWEATAEKRQELLQWKKDAMVLQAREYVEFVI